MRNHRGYTLIEAVFAIVLTGLLAAIALPQIVGAIQNLKLNSAARKILSDIRYARELALSRHGTYGIEVDPANNLYKIFSISGSTKTVLTDPMSQKSMIVNFSTLPEYSGVTIGTVSLCEVGGCPAKDLRFDSFGTPFDSSGTVMASSATIPLSANGVTKTITIHQETAFSEVV